MIPKRQPNALASWEQPLPIPNSLSTSQACFPALLPVFPHENPCAELVKALKHSRCKCTSATMLSVCRSGNIGHLERPIGFWLVYRLLTLLNRITAAIDEAPTQHDQLKHADHGFDPTNSPYNFKTQQL